MGILVGLVALVGFSCLLVLVNWFTSRRHRDTRSQIHKRGRRPR